MKRIRRHLSRPSWTRHSALAALCVALCVLSGGMSHEAAAQGIDFRGFQERHDRVERELDRTEMLWTEVNARAGQSTLPVVRELVESARRIQVQAKDALLDARSAGQQDGLAASRLADQHLRSSLTLTLRARDLATRAARQLREDVSQEETARRAIERAQARLGRVDGDDRRLGQAQQLLDRAETQWREGRFEQALRLAVNASAVIESLEGSDGAGDDDAQLTSTLERLRERMDRARERGINRARLTPITRLLDQAETALASDRPREAAQRLLAARRALDELGQTDAESTRTERALDQLDAQIERIESQFGDRLEGEGDRLLRQAGEARDRARRALRDGDEALAQRHIRAAADLLARLRRLAERG